MIQIRPIKDRFQAAKIEEIAKLGHKPSIGEKVEELERRKPLIGAVKKSLLSLAERE